MNQLLYYCLVKPLSMLPLALLYRLSDLLFPLLYYVIAYRKKVVFENLRNAFPEKSATEIDRTAKLFYRYFCDLLVESIRIFSISEAEVHQRCVIVNPEIFEEFVASKQNIVIVAAHYCNWELAGLAVEGQIPHQAVGLFAPMSSAFWQKKMEVSRTRFGLKIVAKNRMRQLLRNESEFMATVFIIDQAPSNPKKHQYWTNFLNQETGVLLGAEKYARSKNNPVLYSYNRRVRRGYYELEFVLLDRTPEDSVADSITEKHLRLLEQEIIGAPQYWLWTHRRWKHKRPL